MDVRSLEVNHADQRWGRLIASQGAIDTVQNVQPNTAGNRLDYELALVHVDSGFLGPSSWLPIFALASLFFPGFAPKKFITTMLEALLAVFPSVCWILYRCIKLLRRPVEELVEDLHMEIPHAPTICIDAVTHTSVVIHWDIETRYCEHLYYLVLINNRVAATVGATSCTLEQLAEDKTYQLQIVAVNANNSYRSQSAPVYIQTVGAYRGFLLDGTATNIPLNISLKADQALLDITADEVAAIESDEILDQHLVRFQSEAVRLTAEIAEYERASLDEISRLTAEIHAFKKEYGHEADAKHKKDGQVKDLEKKKDRLVYEKMKLWNQLKGYKSSEAMHRSRLDDLATRFRKVKERETQILQNEAGERASIEQQIAAARKQVGELHQTIAATSESVKHLSHEKRVMVETLERVAGLVQGFVDADTVVNKDGSLNGSALEALAKIFEVMPGWQAEVMTEVLTVQGAEATWKAAFRAAIKKYVGLYNRLQTARSTGDFQPFKITEHQASIDFGGTSNALPKTQRGRRTVSSTTSASSTSNRAYTPEPEFADSGDLRRTFGRPPSTSDPEIFQRQEFLPQAYPFLTASTPPLPEGAIQRLAVFSPEPVRPVNEYGYYFPENGGAGGGMSGRVSRNVSGELDGNIGGNRNLKELLGGKLDVGGGISGNINNFANKYSENTHAYHDNVTHYPDPAPGYAETLHYHENFSIPPITTTDTSLPVNGAKQYPPMIGSIQSGLPSTMMAGSYSSPVPAQMAPMAPTVSGPASSQHLRSVSSPMWNDSLSTASLNDLPGSRFGYPRNIATYTNMQPSVSAGAASIDNNFSRSQLLQPYELGSTLWHSDRSYGHSRDGSANSSQIWRQEPTFAKEFSPFAGREETGGERDKGE